MAEPLFDIDPRRRQHRGVLRRPRDGNIRQVRRWLVLVAAPTRLLARPLANWAVRYELRSISACAKSSSRPGQQDFRDGRNRGALMQKI